MKKGKHTPGPWICLGTGVYAECKNHPQYEIIWSGHNTRNAPEEEKRANAELMAAAPKMKDWLYVMVGYVEHMADKDGAAPIETAKLIRSFLREMDG